MKEILSNKYNQTEIVCSVVLIILIVLVPRYIQLPNNVELLFHDRIGQVLLLLLAIFVGSYNLLCGVLLVILFLSLMLKTTEGFDAASNSKDKSKKDNKSYKDKSNSPDDLPTRPDDLPTRPSESSNRPSDPPTRTTENPQLNKDRQISAYKSAINSMQSKIDELEIQNTRPTSGPTRDNQRPSSGSARDNQRPSSGSARDNQRPTSGSSRDNQRYKDDEADDKYRNSPRQSQQPPQESMNSRSSRREEKFNDEYEGEEIEEESFNDTYEKDDGEDNIEGFSCGCDSNSSQVKLIKYKESEKLDSSLEGLFEKFENPPTSVKTPNPYDVAGCRYDMKEDNELHETMYGSPLSSCKAYSSNNLESTGTVFYPLNAF
jgi:hypothetical protein